MGHPTLRTEDNEVVYEAFVDGYAFGDRELEGVLFKVKLGTAMDGTPELYCNRVASQFENYMAKYATQQLLSWYQAAVDYITKEDGEAVTHGNVGCYWGELD